MAFQFLGPDPLEQQVKQVLAQLSRGEPPHLIETTQVDVKEEPGRRQGSRRILPGEPQNDEAARHIAGEMACMANTPGGGAIILGIADDGTRIGTRLDTEWLRHRIWQLTQQKLTVSVRSGELDGCRLLVLTTAEAMEPIRYNGRLRWRVGDSCVDIDPTTWHTGRLHRTGVDWSAQPSGHTIEDVSPVATRIARRYLSEADDGTNRELAVAPEADLPRRLNLTDGDGRLTNAGSLLLVETPWVGIDYIRRTVPGGDSTNRTRSAAPLLEQVAEVERAGAAANRLVHISAGFAHRQLRAIPPRALREAVVNGIVHRDWHSPHPTTVEHIGDTLSVTSPGGFVGGVNPDNIITHPAVPRYRSLAETMAALNLAEREGIGVDRMVIDMISQGRPPPDITEIDGPYVRVVLAGGDPDEEVTDLIADIEPAVLRADVDALLVLEHLSRHGWIDAPTAAPVLHRSLPETETAFERIVRARVRGNSLLTRVEGGPNELPVAYRLADLPRARLTHRLERPSTVEGHRSRILSFAEARGRISSTEAADLLGLSVPYAGKLLAALSDVELLAPSRPNRAGRNFHYVPARSGE
ncbi:MAG: putative DNA binding domain-containing protein [bacterium]|nr:putative DNA binding domain-containing protein [bacterium]